MKQDEVFASVEAALAERSGRVLNKNAFDALLMAAPAMLSALGIPGEPVAALGKLFSGRQDALDAARQAIVQEYILRTLCQISDSLAAAPNKGGEPSIISGEITATGNHDVTGLEVDGMPVHITPGTRITAIGTGGGPGGGKVVGARFVGRAGPSR